MGMKIVCGALAALLFCVAGAIWYVYQKKAVFLPALFGLCGFPKIKESCYYDGIGHFRPATKEDKVGFFMQHPIFGGFYHMFFNLEDNALKAIAPAKYKDFMQAQGRAEQTDTALDASNYLTGLVRPVPAGSHEGPSRSKPSDGNVLLRAAGQAICHCGSRGRFHF